MRRALFRSALLAPLAAALACTFAGRLGPAASTPAGGGYSDAAPPAPGRILLNEILFQPPAGQPQFVELKNIGEAALLTGLSLTNEASQRYRLPEGVVAPPHGVLLIVFDGHERVEGGAVHADGTQFLNPDSGFVNLSASDGTDLDHVAWGSGQPDSVRLSRGGMLSPLEAGTTVGRFPLSIAAFDRLEWVTLAAAQATPGQANPEPGVAILLPISGARFEPSEVPLTWYSVAGAVRYRVQLAAEPSFATPLLDETVEAPPLTAGPLPPGEYYWRVQAMAADGSPADFSPANLLSLRSPAAAGRAAAPVQQAILNVPTYAQYKDTAMLLLESSQAEGQHAWNVAHPGYSAGDPADQSNCAPAVIAMINAFFGGHLSQDRISYEIFKDREPGPEGDLNYADGFDNNQADRALRFALGDGILPSWRPAPRNLDNFWNDAKASIDQGRPIFGSIPGHAFAIVGYSESDGQRWIRVNDPLASDSYDVALEHPELSRLAKPWGPYAVLPGAVEPRSDEPEIRQNFDGDGVVDFDEAQRFHTDPTEKDTDGDKVPDLMEIYASVFDKNYGYGKYYSAGGGRGRDFDGDGKPMELDPDSDGGGCFDGLEDLNQDGKFDQGTGETYNFDSKDDRCIFGTAKFTEKQEDGGHERIATLALSVAVLPDAGQDESQGEVLGTFTVAGTVTQGDCSFDYGASADIQLDLKATGTEDGPYTIQSLQSQSVKETQRHYLCSQPYDVVIDWEISLSLEDINFEDGKYEDKSDEREVILNLGEPE